MSLLTPIGLLGLIGLIILIIIYIIKPNYQSKFISSTYIWKLSLKYRKKKIPISKLRNIILFICQVLILTAAAFVLTRPFIDDGAELRDGEVVLIVDASASMQTSSIDMETSKDVTRFERAIAAASEDAAEAIKNGYNVSLILAQEKSSFILQQVGSDAKEQIDAAFEMLSKDPLSIIAPTTPDIDGAMQLAEQITATAPNATVTMYTDTTYLNSGKVKIHNVTLDDQGNKIQEHNNAILDVRVSLVENYYRIEIDVACYGADMKLTVGCDIKDANDSGVTMHLEATESFYSDETKTIVFAYITEEMPPVEAELISESIELYAYEEIHVFIENKDTLLTDNDYYVYGGHKPTLKVQYCSSLPNNYYTTALLVLQDALASDWALEITEVRENPATEGFDIYIFEHSAPPTVPTDGLVIYTNASNIPNSAGIRIEGITPKQPEPIPLFPGDSHPIMNNINPSNISVTQFIAVSAYDGYQPLMVFDQYPLLLLKDDIDQRILYIPFSLHYSNLALTAEFPLLLRNTINYFFPVTLNEYVYETYDTVNVDIKSPMLEVSGPDTTLTFESFPAEWVVENPGTYTLLRSSWSGYLEPEFIFVKLPAEESNTNLTVDILDSPYFYSDEDSTDLDLLFYFALAIVALAFIEWWLKSREQI